MVSKAWFKDWFNSHYYHILYKHRDDEEANTFIGNLITYLNPTLNSTMLDVACGKGRHSIALNQMGFDVTGIDLSENSINEAKTAENNSLHFYQHDMRRPFWINYFDYAFNFFTSFGYFNTQREHDNAIRSIGQSLKRNGILVIDYLNVPFTEKAMKNTHQITLEGITFYITKWHNETHFFKQIQVTDQLHTTPKHLYTEKVAKFTLGDFKTMLADQHLQIVEVFGNYILQPYHPQQSPRLIILAKKV